MTDHTDNVVPLHKAQEVDVLVHFDRARQELELAASIDEVKKIRDQAEALRQYARQQKLSLEMQNKCAEIKIRAERRAGDILSDMDKHPPGPPSGDRSHDGTNPPRLVDLGISKNQSSRWQSIASIPEDEFEERVEEIKRKNGELTSREFLSLAGYLQREHERHERRERAAEEAAKVQHEDRIRILHGDFREVLSDLSDDSVDLIFSDLPYGKEHLSLYEDLGRFAQRVLKPGKVLACYSGQFHFPHVIRALEASLTYLWVAAVVFDAFADSHHTPKIRGLWKPVLLFSKGRYEPLDWFTDVIKGDGMNKSHHLWEQGTGESIHLIKGLTYEGDLVVDPCCGSGTVPIACKRLNRRFIGCDIDREAVNTAVARLAQDIASEPDPR
jgi:SAM-dependent methyltransferase